MYEMKNSTIGIIFFHADNQAVLKEIFVIKYGTKEIDRRSTATKFLNHMVNFSFKIATTFI